MPWAWPGAALSDYLQSYVTDENVANLGTIKTADLEAVMAAQPDVIFIGGRLAKSYDALSEIAPVVYLATDSELGVVESVRQNAATIASMFGLEDKVDELMAGPEAFKGKDPIDSFCGMWDTHL